jgi:VWFA-related protein
MNHKLLPTLVLLLCVFVPVVAQTNTDDVVKITVNLVQVDAVVTRDGKPVKDLKAEDFEIYEDGKLQTITSFVYVSNVSNASNTTGATTETGTGSKDPNSPSDPASPPPTPTEVGRRRIALVVDDYGLSAQSMANVKRQLRKFIDQRLNPDDLIAIIRTSRARRELPNFTNDKSRINQAWEQLKWNQCSRVGVKSMARVGDMSSVGCGAAVASFDESISSLRAIITAMGQVPGRKSMIVMSNDMPLRGDETFVRSDSVMAPVSEAEEALSHTARLRGLAELAIRSSVVIYGIDAGGLQTTQMTAADQTLRPRVAGPEGNGLYGQELRARAKGINSRRDGATMIAKATGGFLIRDQNEFQLDKILEDQSGYYLIGYRPGTETFNKRFHKIRARVKKPGYEVRTRSGFFGISEEEAKRLKETKK